MVVSLIVVVMAGLDASLRPFKGGNVKRLWRTGYRDAGGQGRRSTCGVPARADICLHAPSGVGHVLVDDLGERQDERRALMHLVVLGAFGP